ncbi:60S ribosomal protein L6 [Capsicum baccatum]|uniref:60S ribosomal protein L6 n=1 Tax=Capsicum baccatum TaxID=33114 RepID=A0A2G2WV77_CAPBA|nr:60S ribosomal protein L6 [Capsicum baccatum]
MYHKKGLWAIKKKNGGKLPIHPKKPSAAVAVNAAVVKPPKFYPADDVAKPLINKHKPKPTKLRSTITPGTVLIILAGRFKGKRVVFLKQLVGSGLLLVTGPFKVNGVPLRRVNQAYVIATSTKVDVSGVNVEKIDDKYFAKQVEKKVKKGEGEFFEEKKEVNGVPLRRINQAYVIWTSTKVDLSGISVEKIDDKYFTKQVEKKGEGEIFEEKKEVNGVPLRRVNQAYVIATSTKVDVSGVNVEKIDDRYFAKEAGKKVKKGEGDIFEEKKEVNGFPLRRVNQAYVIATSTKVDVSGVNVEKIDDKYFAKQVEKKVDGSEVDVEKSDDKYFAKEAEKKEKNVLPQEKKDEQKAVDTALLKAIEGVPELKAYLAARMNLSTKSRVLMVVKVPRKLIKWWGTFNYSKKHEVRKVLGNLVALLDLTPRPDLIEAVLTFGDPNNLVFRFGSCELTLTLAEIFGSLESFDCFWDKFCTTKEKWEQRHLEISGWFAALWLVTHTSLDQKQSFPWLVGRLKIHSLTQIRIPGKKVQNAMMRPVIQPAAPVIVAPPPLEAPTYVVRPTIVLSRSASEPALKVSDSQYYALEPTLRMNESYRYGQPPTFPFDMDKPITTEEQEVIA